MKKTLITGATGGLGSTVVKFLKEKNNLNHLAVLVRDENNDLAKQYKSDGIEIRIGDYDNIESLENAFKDIEVLYFVSGSDINNRLPQHKNVVATAKKVGIKHILYTSTVRKDESSSAPLFPVVDSHKQTEDLIIDSGLNYTILRHSLYAEVIPMFIGDKAQLLQTKSIYLPTANGATAFVPRKDFAEAEAIILSDPETYENKILEFNGSETITFSEIAKLLSETINESITYISPEEAEFKTKMTEVGLPDFIIDMLIMFSLGIANTEFDQQTDDLETVLGRKTQTLKDFLTEVYQ
ncbi:SDR family oxidoreductase [Wenyingzhuangia sp. chi5]|uniref:SDR family oxidoreductase n=1 Tax=Wenyingzhuangia gilva TaxID=3057677 RepID=A0ABT8VN13_9FLAO|nr:SDR family oxidoreductase [Wenyingzhuangia sp. chi5]MDO3693345.1 SDR family oxidoreductase [Wenyingzhuangia sp. chi5]